MSDFDPEFDVTTWLLFAVSLAIFYWAGRKAEPKLERRAHWLVFIALAIGAAVLWIDAKTYPNLFPQDRHSLDPTRNQIIAVIAFTASALTGAVRARFALLERGMRAATWVNHGLMARVRDQDFRPD